MTEVSERFSKKQFFIVLVVHLLSLGGLYFNSKESFIIWIFAHIVFGTIGASIGLHRLYSHRSFEPSKYIEPIIGLLATLCFQGGPIFWAAAHRAHHKFSEKAGDPYNAARGFLWSHIGWLFYVNPNGFEYASNLKNVSDLRKNKFTNWLELNATKLNIGFLIALGIFSYIIDRLDLFFWLGPIRIVSVWHATWLINSYAHNAKFFSRKPLKSYRNSILMCFLIGGDGYHDYHHKFPATCKHAPGHFHLDFGYYLLKVLSLIGIVKLKNQDYFDSEVYKVAQ